MTRNSAEAAWAATRTPEFMLLSDQEKLRFIEIVGLLLEWDRSEFRVGRKPMTLNEIQRIILCQKPGSFSNTEPSFETQMNNLDFAGLLGKTFDGAIYCPVLVMPQTRAEASRNNGLRGGRPKKQVASSNNNAQFSKVPGHGGKTQERENQNLSGNDTTYLLIESTKEVKVSKCSVEDDEYHEIGRAALEAAGFNSSMGFRSYGLVRQWLADGADRDMIIDIIARKTRPHVTTLAYFSKAIAEAIAAKPQPELQWEKDFRRAQALWELTRDGPSPRLADFKPKAVV